MLGHELRNPLAAVLDAVATAQGNAERRDRALTIARRQVEQLARLMDDLLDVGRITQGKIGLKKEPIAVGAILNQAIDEAQCLVASGRHQLNIEIAPEAAACWLEADPARLRQVIGNLIHNAAKFTPPAGRIDLRADCRDDTLVLCVSDNGVGISADLLPRVFDLFTQAERSLDRSHGGLGIGLTLVKRLVEMHGGSVDAASEGPGLGSRFTVKLPLMPAAGAQSATIESYEKSPGQLKILVVEDNADAAEALSMLLEVLGHLPTVVSEGTAAVKAAREDRFDLALVDIGLPEIDGYEVARRIRAFSAAKKMKMVALTGYGQDSDKRRALAAGFNDHLTKPVKVDRLQELLDSMT
jgi:CheY-like chemotaxis protein